MNVAPGPLLAVFAGLMCALAGFRQSFSLESRSRSLFRWSELLPHLQLVMQESGLSLPQAMRLCATEDKSPDKLLRDVAFHLEQEPLLSPGALFERLCPRDESGGVLTRMMMRLGSGTMHQRCQAVEQATREITLMAQSAREKARKDASLWRTLGLTGGICLTLLLL